MVSWAPYPRSELTYVDTSDYEEIFTLCIQGKTDSFKYALQTLRDQQPSGPDPLQPAACLAAQKQHYEILRFCLEQGAIFDRYLTRAAQMGAYTPEMLELLYAENWAGIRSSPDAVQRQILHFGENSFEAQWLKEHAGKEPDSSSELEETGSHEPKVGAESRDVKQRLSPEQIQKWFGDVPW